MNARRIHGTKRTIQRVIRLCKRAAQEGAYRSLGAIDPITAKPLNGTGLPANCWLTTWPTDGRVGGVPNPLAAGPEWIQIGTEGGLLPAPVVIPPTPVNYEYNRRSVTVLNVSTHGLLLGPAERADVIVDFSAFNGKTLILYNDSPAPNPGFDPRIDYYTGAPDQSASGGAPTTLPAYGPNTRTIMQIVVDQVAPNTTPFNLTTLLAAFNGLTGVFASTQDRLKVPEFALNSAYGTAFTDIHGKVQDDTLTFTPIGAAAPVTYTAKQKAIQELFTLDYGRMNATLGTELPLTNFLTQTTIPLGYIDPATEVIAPNETQIWKLTHNGVDTHFIHFHLFNVQVINRVGWDGTLRPAEENELAWKDTVRMNPLEDIFFALKPIKPTLPFSIPNSVRPLDVTQPLGTTTQFTGIDPFTNAPITVTNQMTNFGWEYVWHCHILGHEENDMMRPMILNLNAKSGILWRNSSTGDVYLWNMDGLTHTGGVLLGNIGAPWLIVGVADFNNDGSPAILWRNPSTGDVYLWYMNGVTHTGGVMLGNVAAPWLIVGVADFNYDSKPDILWRNPATGDNYVWYMDGVTHTSGALLASLVGSNWEIQAVGDLNNDVNPDIIWRNTSTGADMVWLMNGVNQIGTSNLDTISDTNWKIVGTE